MNESLTRDCLLRDLDAVFGDAVPTNQPDAAARLGELIARINGCIVDRQLVQIVRSETELSDRNGSRCRPTPARRTTETGHSTVH